MLLFPRDVVPLVYVPAVEQESQVVTKQTTETVQQTVERFVRAGIVLQAHREEFPWDDDAVPFDRGLDKMDLIDAQRAVQKRMRASASKAPEPATAGTDAAGKAPRAPVQSEDEPPAARSPQQRATEPPAKPV